MKNICRIDDATLKILEKVMFDAKRESNADGVLLYLRQEDKDSLIPVRGVSDALRVNVGRNFNAMSKLPALDLYAKDGKTPNDKDVGAVAFLSGKSVNVPDVYNSEKYDFSYIMSFDEKYGYKSLSMLVYPIVDEKSVVVGIIKLINARDDEGEVVPFSETAERMVSLVAKNATAAIEKYHKEEEHRRLVESFVRVIAKTVDDKSSGKKCMHSQKVPLITKKLATAMYDSDLPMFKNCRISENDKYALHLASWLHDCGKLVIPEYLVDKATKLETVHNRIHEIRARFEILLRDARIAYLENVIKNPDDEMAYRDDYKNEVSVLRKEFTFIAKCNVGDVALTERGIEKIKQIAERTYIRNFDRTLGLSRVELDAIDKQEASKFPVEEHLLEDRPEDLVGDGYSKGEIHNLIVKYGTLTAEEKNIIDKHVEVSAEMLGAIDFPESCSNVVKYAAAHHEKLDGTGYPKGLRANALPMPARVLALADVFEALSADDRPYKPIRKLSEILRIMKSMADNGHIDPDLFHLFVKEKVYADYVRDFLKDIQKDEVDENALLAGYDESKTDLTYPVLSSKFEKKKEYAAKEKVVEEVFAASEDKFPEEIRILSETGAKASKAKKGATSSGVKAGKEKQTPEERALPTSESKEIAVVEQKKTAVVAVGELKDETSGAVSGKQDDNVEETGKKLSNDEYLAIRMAEDSSASSSSVKDDASLFSGDDGSKISASEISKMTSLPPLLEGEDDDKAPVFSVDAMLAGNDDESESKTKVSANEIEKKKDVPLVKDGEDDGDVLPPVAGTEKDKGLSQRLPLKEEAADKRVEDAKVTPVVPKVMPVPNKAVKDDSVLPEQAKTRQVGATDKVSPPQAKAVPAVPPVAAGTEKPSVAGKAPEARPVPSTAQVNSVPPAVQNKASVPLHRENTAAEEKPAQNDTVVAEVPPVAVHRLQEVPEPQKKGLFNRITKLFNSPKTDKNLKGADVPPPPPVTRKNGDEDSSVS